MQEIKLIDTPKQTFTINLNGNRIIFKFLYNTISDRWTFDMTFDGTLLLSGRKVLKGFNLIGQFVEISALNLGLIFCEEVEEQGAEPNRNNIPGGVVRILHVTQEEADGASV